jgi:RimJ/RimL family protein N-acetyltransferase
MTLTPVTLSHLIDALEWRNEHPENLRTSTHLTPESQQQFYTALYAPGSTARMWLVRDDTEFIAIVGIVNIQWVNRIGELSLLMFDADMGCGAEVLEAVLDQAFNVLNLHTVYGECYHCHSQYARWAKIMKDRGAYAVELPNRKFWQGRYWDATCYSLEAK